MYEPNLNVETHCQCVKPACETEVMSARWRREAIVRAHKRQDLPKTREPDPPHAIDMHYDPQWSAGCMHDMILTLSRKVDSIAVAELETKYFIVSTRIHRSPTAMSDERMDEHGVRMKNDQECTLTSMSELPHTRNRPFTLSVSIRLREDREAAHIVCEGERSMS